MFGIGLQEFVLVAFMGIGPTELMIVAFIALLLFGNRLPQMMRGMGQGIGEFKKGLKEIESDVNKDSKES